MKLENTDTRRLLEAAIVAARLGGQRAMEEIKYAKSSIKNNSEMVTNADSICQKIIMDRIKETFPDHGFLGEEGPDNKMTHYPPRSDEPFWWVIDPIDGTNNYAHGILNFTVSIAVFYADEPVAAVIFEPATDSMFSTVKGDDAYLNMSRITTSDESINEFASFGVDSHFKIERTDAIIEFMRKTRFRNFGTTALHLAYVAKGSFIGSLTTVARLWDIAAGILLIENAGGIVTDEKGDPVLPVNVETYNRENYNIIAANNKKVHSELLKMLESGINTDI